MSSSNLLQEVLLILEANKKTTNDISWVGNDKISFSWDEFSKVANFRYMGNGINKQLKVVGKGWWLERYMYDGKEWWEFRTLPERESYEYKVPTKKDLTYYCDCREWEPIEDCSCWEENKGDFPEEVEFQERVKKYHCEQYQGRNPTVKIATSLINDFDNL